MSNQPYGRVPVFLVFSSLNVKIHFVKILKKTRFVFKIFDSPYDLMNHLLANTIRKAVVFLESSFFRDMADVFETAIFKHCSECKVLLICSQRDRNMIKEAMEKGFYGSVLEPYDPWEITTILRHLIADLSNANGLKSDQG